MFFHFLIHHLWLIPAGGGAGLLGRYVQMRIRQAHRVMPPDPSAQLLLMHDLHGYNAHSLIAIASGVRLWSCRETPGAIGFSEFGKVWLVAGEPLASANGQAALADRFLQAARAEGRTVGFLPVTERFAKNSSELGLRAIKIGAAPYFDLATWAPRGDRAKKVRAGINQAFRAGIRVTKVNDIDEALRRETECLWKSWLTSRRSPTRFGWLFAVDLFRHSERKRYFAARDQDGKLVGFLAASPIPARQGWYLEDVLRLPNAPNGTTDLLIVEALKSLKRDGAKLATLGTAPMAMEGSSASLVHCSRRLSQMTRLLASLSSIFYNFDGVRHFKAKFAPSWWESEYVLVPQNITGPPRILSAFLQAIIPAGPTDLVTRYCARVWHHVIFATDRARIRNSQADSQSSTSGSNEIKTNHLEARSDSESICRRDFVSVGGVNLHYLTAGSGRPVVLIHGNPGSHRDYTMAVLDKLSRCFQVIAFDRPGHGLSERDCSVPMTAETQATLIRDALRKLDIQKPILVGHSWGGALVLAAAVAYEDELSGIVLLAPAAYPTVSREWWSLIPAIPVIGKFMVHTLTPLIGRAVVKSTLKDAYHPQAVQEQYAGQSAELWTRPEQITAYAYDERTLRSSLKSLNGRYSNLRLPVMIVTGAEDQLLEPEKHAYLLHETIKGSELIVLHQTGHQLPQTRADSVIDAIEKAWRAVDRRKNTTH